MTRSPALPFVVERDVAVATGPELERAKVRHVLLTEPEELPWRTAFGTPLDSLRHRPMDAVQAEIVRLRCRDALATWLPGIDVTVEPGAGDDSSLVLRVQLGHGVEEFER